MVEAIAEEDRKSAARHCKNRSSATDRKLMKAWNPPPNFVPPFTLDDVRTKRSVGNLVAWIKDVRDTIYEERDAKL